MSTFVFRLEKLLELRLQERKQRRAELAQTLEAGRILQEEQERLASEFEENRKRLRGAAQNGSADVDHLLHVHRYELMLLVQQQQLHGKTQTISQETARRQAALVEADKQVRMLEKLREKQLRDFQSQELKTAQLELDEILYRHG